MTTERTQYTECTGCMRMLKLKPNEMKVKRCPTCQAQDIVHYGKAYPDHGQKVLAVK
jgi:LSD1 subclass zinc finger protein